MKNDKELCGRCNHPVTKHTGTVGPFTKACVKGIGRGISCACTGPRKSV
jgi:hypothetical protein